MVISHGTQNFFENTGQWRLFDINMERPHDCIRDEKPAEASLETTMPKPLVKCPQCDPLKDSAWIKREKFQDIISRQHISVFGSFLRLDLVQKTAYFGSF